MLVNVLYQWIIGTDLEWHTKDKEHEKLRLEIHLNLNSFSLKGKNVLHVLLLSSNE